ncbi:AMP-binding protein [Saccharothrix texasensis]|uniref:Acyl-CoA synthetase (AMP-forming)/AMP-acid ligase II n=1 Tax=Saccharothrix texasensis TaxID=103734 RepID=A0A3N1GY31_9PSEU|nr:AMP-binding protein [Saccharothrix texasensis]ROP35016.1 acyl-CoA synthetase (AMP-forming)/AMP-acid ligase II [Saccharothrix texasensis]
MPSAMLDLVTHEEAPPRSPAVHLLGGRTLSYDELAELVREVERSLRHDTKALVLCAGDRDLPTLLAYLAALRLGHAVAFLPASAEILAAYQPEFVVPGPAGGTHLADLGYLPDEQVGRSHVFRRRSTGPAGDIFPDTALLLSTSGTTGSPKAVRLSYDGVADNSDAIARALRITAAERAPTTLPITHAYGLSVLNSHLRSGAGIVLSDRTPLSLAMWDHLTRAGATSFAAVPTTYAAFGPAHLNLLERSEIRTMTQSGARLGDELTMRLVRMMQRRQGRFFPMYGQTEATSRITCLDPAALPDRLGSVGKAVAGGVITIAPAEAHHRAAPGEGAVHYRGPGVMLGYATGRDDLARGPEVDVLDTGDLGYLRDGYLYLTGRTKRIVKVLGVRTSLDDLERVVERSDHPSAVVRGDDDVVYLFGAGDPDVHEQQRRRVAEVLGVPSRHVAVRHVDRLPQTPGGKVDYRALAAAVDTQEVRPWN